MPNLPSTIGIIPGQPHVALFQAAVRQLTGKPSGRFNSGATEGFVLTSGRDTAITVHYREIPSSSLDGENTVIQGTDPALVREIVEAFGGFVNGKGNDSWIPVPKSEEIALLDVERIEVDLVAKAGLSMHEAVMLRNIMSSGKLDAVIEVLRESGQPAPAPGI